MGAEICLDRMMVIMLDHEAQMREKIVKLARFSILFSQNQLSVKVGENVLSCRNPINNEGFLDQDYIIISVSGFENCDLWLFKGVVNVDDAMRDFKLFGVTIYQLDELKVIYKKVAWKMIFSPSTYLDNVMKRIQRCLSFHK